MMIPELTNEELEQIAHHNSKEWSVVAEYDGDQRRWGYDVWVVFTENTDHATNYFRFSYYQGSGDSEIDFEPTPIEQVQLVEKIKHVWEPV